MYKRTGWLHLNNSYSLSPPPHIWGIPHCPPSPLPSFPYLYLYLFRSNLLSVSRFPLFRFGQICLHHIRHMDIHSLARITPTCTLPTALQLRIPSTTRRPPYMASMSSLQTVFRAPPVPHRARPPSLPATVCSIGSPWPPGVFGSVESGYVRLKSSFFRSLLSFLANTPSLPSSGYYVIAIILTVITLFITIFHHQIVDKLTPAAQKVKR